MASRRRVAVVGLLLTVAVASALVWWTRVDVLQDSLGLTVRLGPYPLEEATVLVGPIVPSTSSSPSDHVVLDDLSFVTSVDTAEVEVSALVCTRTDADVGSSLGAGNFDERTIETFCPTLTEIDGPTRLALDGSQYVLVRVAPSRSGRWSLDEVSLDVRRDARHLFRGGTERIEVSAQGRVS